MNETLHGQTQNVEAFKRKLHERIGEWITGYWTQLASALGGLVVGVFTVYGLFSSQVHDASKAAAEAKQAAAVLQATVAQLVTQQELRSAIERIATLEQFERDARGYRPEADINPYLPRPRHARQNSPRREDKR